MIILISVLTLINISLLIIFLNNRYSIFYAVSIITLTLSIIFTFIFVASRFDNNPTYDKYIFLKKQYDNVIKNNVNFEEKINIYKDLQIYNQSVKDNLKFNDNMWFGFVYPKQNYNLKTFDLSIFK